MCHATNVFLYAFAFARSRCVADIASSAVSCLLAHWEPLVPLWQQQQRRGVEAIVRLSLEHRVQLAQLRQPIRHHTSPPGIHQRPAGNAHELSQRHQHLMRLHASPPRLPPHIPATTATASPALPPSNAQSERGLQWVLGEFFGLFVRVGSFVEGGGAELQVEDAWVGVVGGEVVEGEVREWGWDGGLCEEGGAVVGG